MKRAFGNNRRMGGGGGMMRKAIGRAVGVNNGGVQEPVTTRPNNSKAINSVLSLSTCSSNASSVAATGGANHQISPLSYHSHNNSSSYFDSSNDLWDWETIDDGFEDDGIGHGGDRFVFGPVPSKDEVEDAVSSIHHFLGPASYYQLMGHGFSSESETSSPPSSEHDWLEPSLPLANTSMHQGGVVDAFRLLQTQPSIQRAVVSLSTDKAVWDAVLNNNVVRELRDTYEAENKLEKIDGTSGTDAKSVLSWILDNSKATLMEIIKMLTDVFQPSEMEKDKVREAEAETTTTARRDEFQERLKSSLLLSIVVLLIVVMTRARA
ncbi:hypothetical protein ACHQM5_011145 [Ranunculus cassubicifolius]